MSASQLPTARRSPADRSAATAGTSAARTSDSADAGLLLGRYRLARRIGAGGFGMVWMAHDERLGRDVAIKIVPRERVVDGRLEREARAAARLSHPGIVTLYEAAVDDDGAYLVSELVRGRTLGRLLEAGRLSDRDIVTIAIALAEALAYAHGEGIVHRDVKPSNVLVPDRPSSRAHPAKLTDFGIARVLGGDSLTRTGDVLGTAAYMAPEQAEGRQAGPPADLYALALVTYEALTGVNPVRTSTAAVRARRLGAHLPPLRRQRRDLPRELGCGIDLALRPRARERGTLEELRDALSASLPGLSDEPGVVGAAWPRITRSGSGPPEPSRMRGRSSDLAERPPIAEPEEPSAPPPVTISWPARALGASAAAVATGWLASHLMVATVVAPAAIAVLAWIAVLMLPRLGWLSAAAVLIAGTAIGHRPGGALMVLIAMLIPLALLPRRGTAWPLAIAAPLLGAVGLAGAWPAVAARAPGAGWRRAGLAATGYVWLLLASPLVGSDLYLRRPPGTPAPDVWTSSLSMTVHDVLVPIATSGAIAAAPVWGLAAALLPWLLVRRSRAACCVIVVAWSAALLSASALAIAAVHGSRGTGSPPSAMLGAVAGALVALAPVAWATWRQTHYSGNPQAELP